MEVFGYVINLPAEVIVLGALFLGLALGGAAGYLSRGR